MPEYEIHPYCNLFPDISPDELKELAADIADNGQSDPIRTWKKKVLDGKNRLAACREAGVNPEFEPWYPSMPEDEAASDAEALAFVLSKNLHRRHMTTGQRAMVAASLANMKTGDNQHSKGEVALNHATSQIDAAKSLEVSRASVQSAAKVLANGSESLVEAARSGKVKPSDAAKIVGLPKSKQDKAVKAVVNGEAPTVAKAAGIDPVAARDDAIRAAQKTGKPSGGTKFDPTEFDSSMDADAPDEKPTNVPKHLKETAGTCKEFAACVSEAGRLKGRIERLVSGPGGGKLAKWWSDIDRALTQVQTYLKCYRFWAPCPECKITDKHTKAAKDCKLCGGHGWIANTNGLSDVHKVWLKERGVKC